MKINILDAGLAERGGHTFDFVRKLLKQFTAAGHQVHVYGYVGMSDVGVEEFRAYGEVSKVLRPFHYGVTQPYDRYAGEIDQFIRESEILAEDLREVESADVWIWPTVKAQQLLACALRGTDAPVIGCIHEDPGIEQRSVEAMLWRFAFLDAQRRGLNFTMGSVEPEMRHRFTPIVPDRRFAVFAQPYDGPAPAEPRAALKRIGFFGYQRDEKWDDRLAPLLKQLAADGYAVTFQNSNRTMAALEIPGVEMLGFVEDFVAAVAQCDLVVLPYALEQYRNKGSGILMQCVALGIPVVGPIGTMPGRVIEQLQNGPLFVALQGDAIYAAIKNAERNYAAYAANAFKSAQRFAKQAGPARFAASILAAAGKANA